MKHSLIVPCYNEEGNVEKFLEVTKKAMTGYTDDYEIIFVNDGSRDETPKKLRKIFNENKDVRIKVINFSRNFGKEAAMYAGFTEAVGEYVTIIDADLQQDPLYAVEMGRILDEDPDCDMVAAFQEKRKEGKFITACKTMFYKTINKVTEVDFISDASDFRTMRQSVVKTILSLPEYHRFSKGIFSWVGYNTKAIPYEVKERESGETKWNFTKLLKYALDGIIAYTDAPLKMPLYFGIAMGVLSVIFFSIGCIGALLAPVLMLYGFIAASVFFAGAIICVFLGIIGYYLGKIHTQVKDRPIFIAKEILTYDDKD
ncbi:MAG: glycosyltransferase family 2 protein [Ruminococcaceae bacterium]|nr:glycosyltransferase family 2 protein [Oscillospiraceae bacterium]